MSKVKTWLSNNPVIAGLGILAIVLIFGRKAMGGASRSRKLRSLAKARAAKRRKNKNRKR